MFRDKTGLNVCILFAIAVFSFALTANSFPPDIELELRVDSIAVAGGVDSVVLPVYLTNFNDTVSAFEFWLVASRPDIFTFDIKLDTIVDPGTPPDTFIIHAVSLGTDGSVISDWDYIAGRSITGIGHDAKLLGLAQNSPVKSSRGIPPSEEPGQLISLYLNTVAIPDTTQDRTADIYLLPAIDNISFSDPDAEPIGLTFNSVVDTQCYECVMWLPPENEICLQWVTVPPGEVADSCAIDTVFVPALDSSTVVLYNGAVTILNCGDCDGNGAINILDITTLIDYLYIVEFPPAMPPTLFDIDHSGAVNIIDITYLIAYLYQSGPNPDCDGL